jgi:hypothetical protein
MVNRKNTMNCWQAKPLVKPQVFRRLQDENEQKHSQQALLCLRHHHQEGSLYGWQHLLLQRLPENIMFKESFGAAMFQQGTFSKHPHGLMDIRYVVLDYYCFMFFLAGLIDEYRLSIHPVVLGEGKPLFVDLKERKNLKLIDVRKFSSGVVQLCYDSY